MIHIDRPIILLFYLFVNLFLKLSVKLNFISLYKQTFLEGIEHIEVLQLMLQPLTATILAGKKHFILFPASM